MTCNEFLTLIKSRGAIIAPPAGLSHLSTANNSLQRYRCAMLPLFMTELYTHTGGINLGNGYIFGPTEIAQGIRTPVPSITDINEKILYMGKNRGKTIFGRNDLFWFCFDVFGTCYMLDNLTLNPLRKYDDPYRAMLDCLIAGKM